MNFLLYHSEPIKNLITAFAITIGGFWTLWRFVLNREGNAKIEFNIDLKVIGKSKSNNKYIIEAIAIVENRGNARHYVNNFTFDLLYLSENHEIKDGCKKINYQLQFEKLNEKKKVWIPDKWGNSFIDAGITQHYTYVTHVPIESKFILIYAKFNYPSLLSRMGLIKNFHTAQKTFKIG